MLFRSAVKLLSGDVPISIEAGEPDQGRIYMKVVDPLPLTVNGIIAEVDYADD